MYNIWEGYFRKKYPSQICSNYTLYQNAVFWLVEERGILYYQFLVFSPFPALSGYLPNNYPSPRRLQQNLLNAISCAFYCKIVFAVLPFNETFVTKFDSGNVSQVPLPNMIHLYKNCWRLRKQNKCKLTKNEINNYPLFYWKCSSGLKLTLTT